MASVWSRSAEAELRAGAPRSEAELRAGALREWGDAQSSASGLAAAAWEREAELRAGDLAETAQRESTRALESRVVDTTFQRQELSQALRAVSACTERLVDSQGRLQRARDSCREPGVVAETCLQHRQGLPAELSAPDEVDAELRRQMALSEEAVVLLQRVLDSTVEQIRVNRSVEFHLRADSRRKAEAQAIDEACGLLHNNSRLVRLADADNTATATNNVEGSGGAEGDVSVQSWRSSCESLASRASLAVRAGESLLALALGALGRAQEDARSQGRATGRALAAAVSAARESKRRTEEALAQTMEAMSLQEESLRRLAESLGGLEAPLAVCRARLEARRGRPPGERCPDAAQKQLQAELEQLQDSRGRLTEEVRNGEAQLRALRRAQLGLEEELVNRDRLLYIDGALCMPLWEGLAIRDL
ncbi:tektin-1-like [Petromyzon marinus]|uniref:Tektin n=1 Tax=Petromyzon marinus TaxID=7757 RepID=A0AAJ7UKG7_PETMA|nr:tektin-1-like [Petromyzon marinus]